VLTVLSIMVDHSSRSCVDQDGNNRHQNQNVTHIRSRWGFPPGISRYGGNAPDIESDIFPGLDNVSDC
jgi:hypothetical protein